MEELLIPEQGLVLSAAGHFMLTRGTEFAPTPSTPSKLFGVDYTLTTGLLVDGVDGLILDMGSYELKLNSNQAWYQRHFSTVVFRNCKNVTIKNGSFGRATESCLQFQDCINISLERLKFVDFEVTAVSISNCSEVSLTKLLISNNFTGPRPCNWESMMINYLPWLHGHPDSSLSLKWTTPILNYANNLREDATFVSDQFAVSGAMIFNSKNVMVIDLSVGALNWDLSPRLYRCCRAPYRSQAFLIDELMPSQGLYGDLVPLDCDAFYNFLRDAVLAGLPAYILGPGYSENSVFSNGFVNNAWNVSSEVALRPGCTEKRTFTPPDGARGILTGLDNYRRAVRGLTSLWIEESQNVTVSSFSSSRLQLTRPISGVRISEIFAGVRRKALFAKKTRCVRYRSGTADDAVSIPPPCVPTNCPINLDVSIFSSAPTSLAISGRRFQSSGGSFSINPSPLISDIGLNNAL
jgi:hypothetical protein